MVPARVMVAEFRREFLLTAFNRWEPGFSAATDSASIKHAMCSDSPHRWFGGDIGDLGKICLLVSGYLLVAALVAFVAFR